MLLNPGLLKSLIRTYQVIAPVYITVTVSVMKYVLINYFITFLNEEYSRIGTAMRMHYEGKKAFLMEEVIKYLTRKQKTQAVDSGETRDATWKEGKKARQILEDMQEEAKSDFDLVKWANALEDHNPVII
ncbi:polycystin-2 [Biomphalaria pfeifferi]|uniref:Polycystin-2 n=1 Tax=Biomphalaria pfeifferi TaxID=112525 RepID=A0AAD8BSM3_BIOPF|nr:polycystin-2 [Biomphalaria pfeifferi]